MRAIHRTSVHGSASASHEWRRIVDLAWRHGLAAVPIARPEFAVATSVVPDLGTLARRARRKLAAADRGVLHVAGLARGAAADALLSEVDGQPRFTCSSWSAVAIAALRRQPAILELEPDDVDPATTVTYAGRLRRLEQRHVDGQQFDTVELECRSVRVDYGAITDWAGATVGSGLSVPVEVYLAVPANEI